MMDVRGERKRSIKDDSLVFGTYTLLTYGNLRKKQSLGENQNFCLGGLISLLDVQVAVSNKHSDRCGSGDLEKRLGWRYTF